MNTVPMPVIVFFSLSYAVGFFGILKTEIAVNLTAKYFKWAIKMHGFEGEIKPTPRAKIICRAWNIFMLFVFSCFTVLIFFGKLK